MPRERKVKKKMCVYGKEIKEKKKKKERGMARKI
jgi:hypothetical protein